MIVSSGRGIRGGLKLWLWQSLVGLNKKFVIVPIVLGVAG